LRSVCDFTTSGVTRLEAVTKPLKSFGFSAIRLSHINTGLIQGASISLSCWRGQFVDATTRPESRSVSIHAARRQGGRVRAHPHHRGHRVTVDRPGRGPSCLVQQSPAIAARSSHRQSSRRSDPTTAGRRAAWGR
jgi:hypothetical protein